MPPKRYFEAVDASDDTPEPAAASVKKPKKVLANVAADVSATTVHVTGLPESYTTEQLSTLFSDVGPIKSAFVVVDRISQVSKGYGFVKFVLQQDAEEAISTLNATSLEGKKIKVAWANRRQREGEDGQAAPAPVADKEKPKWMEMKEKAKERAAANKQPPVFSESTRPSNVDPKRTIIIRGLPTENEADSKKALYKKAKKLMAVLPNVAEDAFPVVEFPVTTSEPEPVATILCPTPRIASLLSNKLNNHIIKSSLLTTALQFEYDAVSKKGRSAGGGRLVLRNLHYEMSAQDIRSVFAPFGSLHSIDLPVDSEGKGRGFGFVWMLRKVDAEKAMAKVNGKTLYPGMGEQRKKEGGEGKKQTRQRKKEEGVAETLQSKGRVVAVDWALGKGQWQEAQKGEQKPESDEASASGSGSDDSEEDDSEEDTDEEDGSNEDSDASAPEDLSSNEDEDEAMGNETSAKGKDVGTTLFVRNIQFEATEDELYALFKAFGPVKYARIVMDPISNRSRGTGFVCFYRDEDAQKVLEESDKLVSTNPAPAANPFSQPSLLVPDPSSGTSASLALHGRVLGVSPAVSRDNAEQLREDRDKKGEKKDRRNIYLLKEGVIDGESKQADDINKTDLEARTASYEARKALLRTNPSLYVSRVRLSVRQLPLYATDSLLRKIAMHALREWPKEVKARNRKDLKPEELKVEEEEVEPVKVKKDGTVIPPARVRQAKVLRQADRLDPLTGLGRSKGYGFLEVRSHADALKVLRYCNANSDIMKLLRTWWQDELKAQIAKEEDETRKKRLNEKLSELRDGAEGKKGARTLIIELSIENAQTVRRREQMAEKSRERSKRKPEEKSDRKGKRGRADEKPSKGNKKARTDSVAEQPATEKPANSGQGSLGSLIGKRRREKKAKRA